MKAITILLTILLAGCASMTPVVPDSIAPDGKTYSYILWPKQGAFWPVSGKTQRKIEVACLFSDPKWSHA